MEAGVTAAIIASIFNVPLKPNLVGGVICHVTPLWELDNEGAQTDWLHSTSKL
jgi:hypothetical protein